MFTSVTCELFTATRGSLSTMVPVPIAWWASRSWDHGGQAIILARQQ
jgi:hypothetical protein